MVSSFIVLVCAVLVGLTKGSAIEEMAGMQYWGTYSKTIDMVSL